MCNKNSILIFSIVGSLIVLSPSNAFAYLGPGLGGGVVIATLGLLFVIIAGIFGILWFPLKKLFMKFKKSKKNEVFKEDEYNHKDKL